MRKNRSYRGIIALFVVVLIGFTFTLGGNLVDYFTGGNGTHSWYGRNGVLSRLGSSKAVNPMLGSTIQISEGDKKDQDDASSPLKYAPDQRYAPFNPAWLLKPAPAGALNIPHFTVANNQISCVISTQVECIVNNFVSANRPGLGSAARFVLTDSSATGPESTISASPSLDTPPLTPGSSTVSGDYACTAGADNVDCWNLKTGQGFTLSSTKAESYRPELPKRYATRAGNSAPATDPGGNSGGNPDANPNGNPGGN